MYSLILSSSAVTLITILFKPTLSDESLISTFALLSLGIASILSSVTSFLTVHSYSLTDASKGIS